MTWKILSGQDDDVVNYIAAVEAADGQTLEPLVRLAYHNFIIGCKVDGIWNAIKASCILAGARTLSGALVPLKGTAPTNFNFVAGDYDRKTGLVGDGVTKYLNSNRIASNQPQNNAHISVCVTTVATSFGGNFPVYIGSFGDTSGSLVGSLHFGRNNNNGSLFGRGGSQTYEPDLGSGTATGFKGISRSTSSGFTYRNNSSSATIVRPSETPGNAPVLVFAVGTPLAQEYVNGRMSFYSIGESLDLALLDARVTRLVSDLAAAVP